jgi:ParB family chromosome partitioning protein
VAETPPRRGLGRGLAALVAEFPTGQVSLIELELSQIRPNPRQPRDRFDDDALARLADSITAEGVVQPIVVRDIGDGFQIVAGERRWRAAQRAGLRTIPAIVRQADDRESLILALTENVAREDLNPVEQARAYAVLSDELDLTQSEIARRLGKSRPAVANTLRLLELPDEVLEAIAEGVL